MGRKYRFCDTLHFYGDVGISYGGLDAGACVRPSDLFDSDRVVVSRVTRV